MVNITKHFTLLNAESQNGKILLGGQHTLFVSVAHRPQVVGYVNPVMALGEVEIGNFGWVNLIVNVYLFIPLAELHTRLNMDVHWVGAEPRPAGVEFVHGVERLAAALCFAQAHINNADELRRFGNIFLFRTVR